MDLFPGDEARRDCGGFRRNRLRVHCGDMAQARLPGAAVGMARDGAQLRHRMGGSHRLACGVRMLQALLAADARGGLPALCARDGACLRGAHGHALFHAEHVPRPRAPAILRDAHVVRSGHGWGSRDALSLAARTASS